MKDKFKVHVYRDSSLRKDDYAFEWEGELSYILVNDSYIRITDWSYFEDALDSSNITDYYNVVFWRYCSENDMFEIGQASVVNKKPYTTIL
jgi:hypothetical protein